MECVPPRHRPHYRAVERLAVLELRAARGWSAAQTAGRFFVTEATITDWMARLDEDGPAALVRTPEPVNRFPDLVAHLVRRLKVLCPAMGTARIAAVLSRAGLHLGRTTVRRMLKRRPRCVAPAATVRSERCIRSSYPNHIWLVDLTTVPTLAGFWVSWLPWSVPQRWPFCCWVAVGVDHFSRRIMGVRVFRGWPSAAAISAFLVGMIRAAGQGPRHLITDRGKQFTARAFRRRCRRAGISGPSSPALRAPAAMAARRSLCSATGAGPRAAWRAARTRGPVPGRASAPSRRLADPRGVRAGTRSSVPAGVAVCPRAAQPPARRAIPVAVLTLRPISPR